LTQEKLYAEKCWVLGTLGYKNGSVVHELHKVVEKVEEEDSLLTERRGGNR